SLLFFFLFFCFFLYSTSGVGQLWPSSCCRTTSPMRHCKTDSYKHDSQRQRHDGTRGGLTIWKLGPCPRARGQ
ncbi:unnamed protein product, partial [Staurois parvus]